VKDKLITLSKRIKAEMRDIERTADRVQCAWELANRSTDQKSYYLDSVALNLHSFYNGLERIFESIARQLDPVFPSSERWHRELLEQMTKDIPGVRPVVLSVKTAELLVSFLAFRHLVRGIYAFELKEDLLQNLVDLLTEVLSSIKQDLEGFCKLLFAAAEEDYY